MASGLIKLTPAELKSSATKYTNGANSVQQVLQSLTTEQGVISSNWSGSAFQKFDTQFNTLKPKVQQFIELLNDIDKELVSVANTIEQTDQQIASQINAL